MSEVKVAILFGLDSKKKREKDSNPLTSKMLALDWVSREEVLNVLHGDGQAVVVVVALAEPNGVVKFSLLFTPADKRNGQRL